MSTLTQLWGNQQDAPRTENEIFESNDPSQVTQDLSSFFPMNQSEDDDFIDKDVDLTEEELLRFTQTFEEEIYEYTEEKKDDLPEPIDLSQSWQDSDEVQVVEPSTKRPRHTFKDSEELYFLEIDHECRIFKVGESFLRYDPTSLRHLQQSQDPHQIYTIIKLYTSRTGTKMAVCRVSILAKTTFIAKGNKGFDKEAFEQKFGKYVCKRMSVDVRLRDLGSRFEGELPAPKLFYEGPKKQTKVAGWTVAYGFDGCFGKTEKCVVEQKPTAIDLFAGAGGMAIGLEAAGFKLK